MSLLRSHTLPALLLGGALAAAGCGKTSGTTLTPTTVTTNDPSPFTSLLYPGGTAFRRVTVTQAGTLSVTVTSLTPPGALVGVGIGIPDAGAPCTLTYVTRAGAGASPALSATVEPGNYCAGVFSVADPGGEPTGFFVKIAIP